MPRHLIQENPKIRIQIVCCFQHWQQTQTQEKCYFDQQNVPRSCLLLQVLYNALASTMDKDTVAWIRQTWFCLLEPRVEMRRQGLPAHEGMRDCLQGTNHQPVQLCPLGQASSGQKGRWRQKAAPEPFYGPASQVEGAAPVEGGSQRTWRGRRGTRRRRR